MQRTVQRVLDPQWILPRSGCVLALLLAVGFPVCSQSTRATRLQTEAKQAQAAGNDPLAISLYPKALEQSPAWTEGWWRYGGLLYEEKEFDRASIAFAHLTQLSPENPLGFALLGLCEYEQGDWNNASLHLNKALNHGGLPKDIANPAMYHFGLALMRQRNRSGALIVFRLLQHNEPKYPNLVQAFGSAELNLGTIPPPESPTFGGVNLAGEASIAVLELRSADAEKLYQQLVRDYASLPFTHLCLALFLENLGKDGDAEQALKAESVVNPTSPDPWIWLARIALARRDAAGARADAAQALKLSPNDGLCYLISGRSLIIDQQWEKARADLQKAEALVPDSYEVHYSLIAVYTALHEDAEAASERKLFAKAFTAAHPTDEVVHP